MTEKNKVIRISKSFVLGFCICSKEISIVNYGYLKKYCCSGHVNKNKFGKLNPNWKRGKIKLSGYWYIYKPDHHFANCMGYVAEHRLVYEEFYNCFLLPYTELHHINENILDNRIQNLKPLYKGQHSSLHNIGKKYAKKDMSDRYCLICQRKTWKTKKGYEKWFVYKNGFICLWCYMKLHDNNDK